jgi:hypothetical protein
MLTFRFSNGDHLLPTNQWTMYLLWDRDVTNITIDDEGIEYNKGGTPSIIQFHPMDFIRLYVKYPANAKEKLLPAKREWI